MTPRPRAALINLGISPGVTNVLIGLRLHQLRGSCRRDLQIKSVHLYLLEDIDADEIIFSWSPLVALEELAERPRLLRDGRIQVLEPFRAAREHHFPGEVEPTRQYTLYQEELLSLHRSFPEIESIGVYTGGSEVELVKALFEGSGKPRQGHAKARGKLSHELIDRSRICLIDCPERRRNLNVARRIGLWSTR